MGLFDRLKKKNEPAPVEASNLVASGQTSEDPLVEHSEPQLASLDATGGLYWIVSTMQGRGQGRLEMDLSLQGSEMNYVFSDDNGEQERGVVAPGDDWFKGVAALYTESERSEHGAFSRAHISYPVTSAPVRVEVRFTNEKGDVASEHYEVPQHLAEIDAEPHHVLNTDGFKADGAESVQENAKTGDENLVMHTAVHSEQNDEAPASPAVLAIQLNDTEASDEHDAQSRFERIMQRIEEESSEPETLPSFEEIAFDTLEAKTREIGEDSAFMGEQTETAFETGEPRKTPEDQVEVSGADEVHETPDAPTDDAPQHEVIFASAETDAEPAESETDVESEHLLSFEENDSSAKSDTDELIAAPVAFEDSNAALVNEPAVGTASSAGFVGGLEEETIEESSHDSAPDIHNVSAVDTATEAYLGDDFGSQTGASSASLDLASSAENEECATGDDAETPADELLILDETVQSPDTQEHDPSEAEIVTVAPLAEEIEEESQQNLEADLDTTESVETEYYPTDAEFSMAADESVPEVIDESEWEQDAFVATGSPNAQSADEAAAPGAASFLDVAPSYTLDAHNNVVLPSKTQLAAGNLVLTEADVVERLRPAQLALFGENGTARDVSTVLIRIRSLGSYYDALTHVRRDGFWDQQKTFELVPEEVLDLLQLKSDSYKEGYGAPLAMMLRFTPGVPVEASFDYSNEEAFVQYPDHLPAQQYVEELRMFPRTGANIPEHMSEALASWTL
ncbi:hypothetical protein [Rothia sp. ZJ1223]|uniref:hypothetical protein n=1 Tax=Rothia sp. ZJ1223 TaxID=2811098 RepID=UPI00195EA35F|nr:hypothetical protein [Rothia sp. ZJ1223]MBM7051458.1 hypothetical protein [Rothia sp. ZJ1223]